jgi:hypothetical protein
MPSFAQILILGAINTVHRGYKLVHTLLILCLRAFAQHTHTRTRTHLWASNAYII